jgi:L-2-hydroxyglutarate oxidase
MNSMKKFDVIVVGGGVIGLSVATAVKTNNTNIKVLIVDKEPLLGVHASGRNSGVIHAGFYYSPDSLKAKFCLKGNIELSNLIARHKIPILKCGKVVVTRNSSEEKQIEKLYSRGVANGVDIRVLPRSALKNIEPLAATYVNFLWSPNTSVSDPSLVIKAMQKEAEAVGVEFTFESELNIGDSDAQINGQRISFRHLVNCAGSYALDVAKSYDFGSQYLTLPFLGRYLKTSEKNFSLKTLIYPVPHPINPFLGIHLTRTIDGNIKIGPTAIPLFGKEQYSPFKGIKLREIFESTKSLVSLIKGSAHDVSEILITEMPKISTRALVKEVSSISPGIQNVKDWCPAPGGIRAQLVDILKGELVQDFILEGDSNSTHVLNAVSPGWTSAIPFGEYIAERVLNKL